MRIKERNYPHPVLASWGDDIAPYNLDCGIEVKVEKPYYYFIYKFSVGNATICELLRQEKASIVFHVECGATFYRKAFPVLWKDAEPGKILEGSIAISYDELSTSAEICTFICSNGNLIGYAPVGMHPDYEKQNFQMNNGDVVGIWKTITCPLDRENEPFKRIASIINFCKSEETVDELLTVAFDENKLLGLMSPNLWNMYILLKDNPANTHILSTMLVIPVLMEGLNKIRAVKLSPDETHLEEYRNKRWFRLIERRLSALNIKIESEGIIVLAVAEKILDFPYLRASQALSDFRASLENEA